MTRVAWQSWTNEEWVDGLRRGDRATLRGLIELLTQRVRRLFRQLPPEDLRQLEQEAVTAAVGAIRTRLDTFRGGASFATWATKIVQNKAKDQLRKQQAPPYMFQPIVLAGDDDEAALDPADPQAEAAFIAVEAEGEEAGSPRLAALAECLAGLSPRELAALTAQAQVYDQILATAYYYRLRWEQEERRAREEGRTADERLRPPKRLIVPARREALREASAPFEIKPEALSTYINIARTKMQRCLASKGFGLP